MNKLFCWAWLSALVCTLAGSLLAAPVKLTEQTPVAITTPATGVWRANLRSHFVFGAQVELPAKGTQGVFSARQVVSRHRDAFRWVLDQPVSGKVQLEPW